MPEPEKKLRRGIATGACLAAGAVGAWLAREGEPEPRRAEVLFPDGSRHEIGLFDAYSLAGCGIAVVRKDAGDDPDITDGALFKVTICESDCPPGFYDHRLVCGRARLLLRGGPGIGLVTRPGLDTDSGFWAINPVPRRMLVDNLEACGLGRQKKTYLVLVEAPDGVRLAAKTLNPVLGVVDGLSILGTSGYVEPYSHQAYIETIRILLKGARRAGCRTAALCTGGRTARAVARDHPELPDHAIIRIADFIADSLKLAAEFEFDRVIVACMAGKLYKYSTGLEYTHAHTVRSDCGRLAQLAADIGVDRRRVEVCRRSGSVREAMTGLRPDEISEIYERLGRQALAELTKWFGREAVELRLYDPRGALLKEWM